MSRSRRNDTPAAAPGDRSWGSLSHIPDFDPSLVGLFDQLSQHPMLASYRDAFEQATGMPLWLEPPAESGAGPPVGSSHCPSDKVNPFCRKIFWTDDPCQPCVEAHALLVAVPGEKAATIRCFAGLQVTAVPVWMGTQILGYLRTGQVFSEPAGPGDFSKVSDMLRQDPGFRERDLEPLRPLFLTAPAIATERYAALVQLLVFFSEQLSALAERLLHAGHSNQPEAVKKACAHMRRYFDQEITLDELSRAAGVSAHHLCAVFKEATGVTMIEYLNRERVLQAKKRLLSRYARVSEVALDVGFGSLSQFNRCFSKYAGESPTEYRRRVLAPARGLAA
ncbi:MAG: helix-turn-helix domain-containing protein [Verrucomicrobiales bacterium]